MIYAEDSFFTLDFWQRAGLLAVSLALAGFVAWGAYAAFRVAEARLAPRLAMALGVFWGFAWLSPQVYYLYYQSVIPGLPWQMVIGWPPRPDEILRLIGFQAAPSLSDHSKGVMAWALLVWAAWPAFTRLRFRRSR